MLSTAIDQLHKGIFVILHFNIPSCTDVKHRLKLQRRTVVRAHVTVVCGKILALTCASSRARHM